MLNEAAPYYQAGLENKLVYEITFNDYNRCIICKPEKTDLKADGKYKISDISLEYEIITHQTLANHIQAEYQSMVLLYDKVLRQKKTILDKSDSVWNFNFNTPAKSLKGILMLFEEEKDYERDTSKFYNPKIQKVSITVEGKPNQLFSQGMQPYEQYDEI